jgi:hypothetical protein
MPSNSSWENQCHRKNGEIKSLLNYNPTVKLQWEFEARWETPFGYLVLSSLKLSWFSVWNPTVRALVETQQQRLQIAVVLLSHPVQHSAPRHIIGPRAMEVLVSYHVLPTSLARRFGSQDLNTNKHRVRWFVLDTPWQVKCPLLSCIILSYSYHPLSTLQSNFMTSHLWPVSILWHCNGQAHVDMLGTAYSMHRWLREG